MKPDEPSMLEVTFITDNLESVRNSCASPRLRYLVLCHRRTGGHSRRDFEGRLRRRHRIGRCSRPVARDATPSGGRDYVAHPVLYGPVRPLGIPQALGSPSDAISRPGHGRVGERSSHPADRRVNCRPVRCRLLVQPTTQSPAGANERPERFALGHGFGIHELHQFGRRSAAADVPPSLADGQIRVRRHDRGFLRHQQRRQNPAVRLARPTGRRST